MNGDHIDDVVAQLEQLHTDVTAVLSVVTDGTCSGA